MSTQSRNEPDELQRHVNKAKRAVLEMTENKAAAAELWGLHSSDVTTIEAVDQALTDARMDWGKRQLVAEPDDAGRPF